MQTALRKINCLALLLCLIVARVAQSQPKFEVTLPEMASTQPWSGRLVVYLLPADAQSRATSQPQPQPANGIFYSKPRPMFGITVNQLRAGAVAVLDDQADSYPDKMSRLPAGRYLAQAVLVVNRTCSDWHAEEGNWFSMPEAMEIASTRPTTEPVLVHLNLDQQTHASAIEALPPGLELFSMRSKLLSDFAGHEVRLNATVLLPSHFQPGRKYATLYHIPGYGGRHWDGIAAARKRLLHPATEPAQAELSDNLFEVFLDPETPTGHCLFCDSDVNGPWGSALTRELIPALEAKYPLRADPMARLLRGHSSGGWSTLWLATNYPELFGATWSTSPDPVSFHRFVTSDLYDQDNFYRKQGNQGQQIIFESFRKNGVILHVEDENRMEQIIGPGHTSGEQWASWLSCWGHRGKGGLPVSPWDPLTGAIDHTEAESFRRFDILDRLEHQPALFGPLFKQRIRLVVGGEDNFYLNEAVELLKLKLDALKFNDLPEGEHGYITIVPGLGHSTLFASRELAAFPAQMLEHLKLHHYLVMPATHPATQPVTQPINQPAEKSPQASGPIHVEQIHWQTANGPVHGYQAEIDLTDPKLLIHVTSKDSPPQDGSNEMTQLVSVDQWAIDNHLRLAINANYFGWKKGGGQIIGLLVNERKVISPTRHWHGKPDPGLVLVQEKSGYMARVIGPGQLPMAESQICFAVAGVGGSESDPERGSLLVHGGKNLGATARVYPDSRLARTAVGVDATGHRLWIITIDGRQKDWSVGITLPDLADRLIKLGVTDAVNLDGGGSTSFVYQAAENQPMMTNRPCDESAAGQPGVFRPVAVQLGFSVR